VRRHLRSYGIHPSRWSPDWHLAWKWAHDIGRSYYHFQWPSAAEIGAQYLLLVLAKMKEERYLRLPHRAAQQASAAVLVRLGGQALPAIGFSEGQ
jgi:hypothetical protein